MSSDPRSSDFVYKEYSLEQLDNWISDVLNNESLTAQEIYDAIIKSVKENVKHHQKELDRSKELLSLMTDSKESNITYGTYADWTDFWEESHYPEEFKQYTEDELDAMCDAAAEQEERDRCREYNLREAEYYNQRALIDAEWNRMKDDIQSKSPYNDGWTQEHYKNVSENLSKELEEIRTEGGYEWTPRT